jgi:hypothetical protein
MSENTNRTRVFSTADELWDYLEDRFGSKNLAAGDAR